MSRIDVVRAWRDEEYRLSLSEAERAELPEHPAGLIELQDADLEGAAGGQWRRTLVGPLCVRTRIGPNCPPRTWLTAPCPPRTRIIFQCPPRTLVGVNCPPNTIVIR
jgi:mersacidin/lichenicidin family type 2 lantibiotic